MKIEINNVDVKTCKGDLIRIKTEGSEELDVTINGKKIIKTKKTTLWGKIKSFFNVSLF